MRLKVILGVTFVVGINACAPRATAQMQQHEMSPTSAASGDARKLVKFPEPLGIGVFKSATRFRPPTLL